MPPVRAWDGQSYDRISGPMEALGREVLERLVLAGDETVIDAGCGSGRITQALLERLPDGSVIAVDASASMIEAAAERLQPDGAQDDRLALRRADLLGLELDERVDAVLSTATFHWIADHERLFLRLRALLRDGGQLVAQCGGAGNITKLRACVRPVHERDPYAEHFGGWRPPWNYADPETTRERLLRAGFAQANCWLQEAPREPEHPREFLATIVLGPHVQQLPEQLRDPFMDEVMAELGEPVVVDYVRLNIDALA
ncbi:MAG TPA: methyltransferase domain-containing protein [Solirubrobacteraceae bacterium]|jgi:trans-aconitate 2-methyltransferase|nr:methyltransferase domain-containing protein [Solirubrobacteraceae bacterium]